MSVPGADDYAAVLAQYRRGELAGAGAAAQALLAREPEHAGALQIAGLVEARQGRFDSALGWLERAVACEPGNAELHNHLGNVLLALEREDAAIAAYEQAVALGLEDPHALNNRGAALQSRRRFDAALQCFERALELRPDFADALLNRGELLVELGRRSAGIESLQRARAAGADDAKIGFALASLGVEPAADRAPPEFVRELFDQYAHGFDDHLTGRLGYRAPELIGAALQPLALGGAAVVDLGCGTGLCAPLLRPLAARLDGIDLSGAMLEQARARGLYDELLQAEIVAALGERPGRYDLAVAADVLIYFGALEPVLAAVRATLRPRGWFVFTLEAGEGADHELRSTRRYAHGSAYVARVAQAQGFALQRLTGETLRSEGGAEVAGHLVVLQRG
ncbi:tetratricopeptide repeat protein [Piscinibacter defluvii]|uniref:tetratricopeptide repeat protein n=1 Tax=Piscinibacter defluvii TaxID=1796922 RepID=UPI0013E31906|nr:tetratricopeptide repeat protein [Piscinibacter defluvii]